MRQPFIGINSARGHSASGRIFVLISNIKAWNDSRITVASLISSQEEPPSTKHVY